MKLSELVFEIVKNVKYLEESSFNYEAFIRGEFDQDPDYANSINNAFAPLNEAIHRLSDLNKIKFKIEEIQSTPDKNGLIDISSLTYDIKKIVNVFSLNSGEYTHIEFREFGKDKLLLFNASNFNNFYIEYIQDIKHFSKLDIYFIEDSNSTLDKRDVELKEIGINETMCSYIIEYCQGKLLEPIAPELANLHLTRAEQYFNDLDTQQTSFCQKNVTKKYRI